MKVKLERIKKGISQKKLCEIVKTSPKKLVEIERGNYDKVNLELAKRIANALESSIEELFLNDDKESK